MTTAHLQATLFFYLNEWQETYTPTRMDTSEFGVTPEASLSHAMWMCQTALSFIKEDEVDKAHRWLGCVQGMLYMSGTYTFDEMRAHSTEQTDP